MAKARIIRNREILAIQPEMIRSGTRNGRRAIWWDMGPTIAPNETHATDHGPVAVVNVRGSIEHHPELGCDSYEGIRERVCEAFDSEDTPIAVVLRIDSPGGVVSGLNETVRWLRAESEERGIPLIAYVDELACSAAFALCCGCSEVYAPSSAIIGSIGVISTMFDQVQRDLAMGLRFETITSGARKADGHPHVEIADEAIAEEKKRVGKLARQFYRLVSEARGIPMGDLVANRGYEAGIFLAGKAFDLGLCDGVLGWDSFLAEIGAHLAQAGTPILDEQSSSGPSSTSKVRGNETDRKATHGTPRHTMNLRALLRRRKAELAQAKSGALRKTLRASIAALEAAIAADAPLAGSKKVKHTKETHTEESSDEGGEEDEEEDEESADSGDSGDSGDDDGDDDGDSDSEDDSEGEGDEEDEEDEEEESAESGEGEEEASAKAVLALARKATGRKGRGAVAALAAMISEGQRASARVRKIEQARANERKERAISDALKARRITPAEAKDLRRQPFASYVKPYLAARKNPIVFDEEDGGISMPSGAPGAELPASVMKQIDHAVKQTLAGMGAMSPEESKARAEALRAKLIESHRANRAAANGVSGRV